MATEHMGLTLPTVGGSTGTWGTTTNDNEELIDAHDHTTGKGVPIPTAGLDIDADLTFAGNAAINLKAAQMTAQASAPALNRSIWVDTSGDLYYRNAAGTSVQITSGGQLDVSSVGGIAGDYAAAGASLYYDDAADTYRFLSAAPLPNVWSSVSAGDIDLYEKASGITNRVRLKSPAALAASYTVTLPAAVPAQARPVAVGTTGTLVFGHGEYTRHVGILEAIIEPGASRWTADFRVTTGAAQASNWACTGGAGALVLWYPVPLLVGERIKTIRARVLDVIGSTVTLRLFKTDIANNSQSQVGATITSDNSGTRQTLTLSGLTETITTGFQYLIAITAAAASNQESSGIELDFDWP